MNEELRDEFEQELDIFIDQYSGRLDEREIVKILEEYAVNLEKGE